MEDLLGLVYSGVTEGNRVEPLWVEATEGSLRVETLQQCALK